MKSTLRAWILLLTFTVFARLAAAEPARNVAPLAAVSASAASDEKSGAEKAVDGRIAEAGAKLDGMSWSAPIKDHPQGVTLTFAWEKPTPVATVVYYGRTAFGLNECFKDYELYLDEEKTPAVKGAFATGHGPQLVDLPRPATVRKVTLKFLNGHAGKAGASEVQIYTAKPDPGQFLCRFTDFERDIRYAFYPSHNRLGVLAPKPPADAKTWHAAVRSLPDGKLVVERSGPLPMSPAGEYLELPALANGDYRLTLTLAGGAEPVIEERPFRKESFEWEGQNLGLDDVVVPPFEPLTVEDKTVGCVQRRHAMNGVGLWDQVMSQGRPLLAGPVRIEATTSGRTVAATGSSMEFTRRTTTQVSGRAGWSAGNLQGATEFTYDYDGLMQLTLHLQPTTEAIDKLQLVIPLKASETWLMHPVTTGLRQHYAGRIPSLRQGSGQAGTPSTGPGQADKVWDSSSVRDRLAGVFVPYLFVGGPERGVCFAADNDRDWIRGEGVPMMELERDGETVNLRLNLIATPSKLSRERTLRFALQATPAKPMPETPYTWRRWWATRNEKDVEDVQIAFWGGNGYWGGRHFASSVFPDGKDFTYWEKLAEQRRTGKLDKAFEKQWFDRYASLTKEQQNQFLPAMKAGFGWSSFTPANTPETKKYQYVIPYLNARGAHVLENRDFGNTYLDEWQRTGIADPAWPRLSDFDHPTRQKGWATWYHVEPVPSRIDMLLYYHKKMLETFADGIYWDNMFLGASYIPAEAGGPGYVDDNGKPQPGVNLMAFRSLVRRAAVMMHVMGKRPILYIHMTNVNLVPMLAFGTLNLDWEWRDQGPEMLNDLQDRLGADHDTGLILAQSLGLQAGNISIGIDRFTPPKNSGVTREWLFRTVMAVCFPHEIKIYQGTKDVTFVQNELAKFGYGQPDCRVYRYWEDGFPLQAEGANMRAMVLSRGGKSLIALGNYGPAKVDAPASTGAATDAPSLEDYDAAQRGLKKPETQAASAAVPVRAETYTVRLRLDLKALGLPENAQARDVELRAGHTKTGSLKAMKLPRAGEGVSEDKPEPVLQEGDASQLKRIAPGIFDLAIRKHDFALIEVGE